MTRQPTVLALAIALATLVPHIAVAQPGAALTVANDTSGVDIPPDLPMMLLRQSFAESLKQRGLTLDGWLNACRTNAVACAQGMQGVSPALAGAALMQGTEARFDPVPPGSYYVFAMGNAAGTPMVWDLRVDLRAGANALRLDERNHAMAPGAPAAAAAAPAGPSVDASIAKARAAKVDTRVFGIPLGEPLRLPTCNPLGALFSPGGLQASPTCVNDTSGAANLLTALLPVNLDALENVAMIELAADSCPAWMAGCTVRGLLDQGNLVGVELTTKGRDVEQTTGTELRGKYGPPTSLLRGTVTPDVGNPFPVTDLIWSLPGLRVEYQPVRRIEGTDSRVKTNEGLVRIETEQAYQSRQREVKEQAKPKL